MDRHLAPIITVLMAVHNAKNYVSQTIQSILDQSFKDFEFLIIDDGSTDGTSGIISKYTDSRIRVVKNQNNLGLVRSLNIGLKNASGKYIARIDADDLAAKNRLEMQHSFLSQNTQIGIVGSHMNYIDEKNIILRLQKYPLTHREIKAYSLFGSPFGHPTVMFQKDIFIVNNLFYDEAYATAEDYELWQRALKIIKGANCDELLLSYRLTTSQISSVHFNREQEADGRIKMNYLRDLDIDEKYIDTLSIFLKNVITIEHAIKFPEILKAIEGLFEANKEKLIFDQDMLKAYSGLKIDTIVRIYSSRSQPLYNHYKNSAVFGINKLNFMSKMKIKLKQIYKMAPGQKTSEKLIV
ncbi:MAG: glycosyltransferase [Flavobacterium sp.]|nr:MAG: glycosyltransferase [Flavobacterium sp.]